MGSTDEYVKELMAPYLGEFQLTFVGAHKKDVVIESVMFDSYSHPIYFIADDGSYYNWSTIIRMVRR